MTNASPDTLHPTPASMARDVVMAMLANPNTTLKSPEDVEKALKSFETTFKAMNGIAATPPAPVESAPAAVPAVEKAEVQEEVREPRPTKALPRMTPARRAAQAEQVWPEADKKLRSKFLALIDEHGLRCAEDGTPLPAKRLELLISPDRSRVMDPISGNYFAMLKHHLRTAYNLSTDEIRTMFKLTAQQLPQTGPAYSSSKKAAAIHSGLGHRKRDQKASA